MDSGGYIIVYTCDNFKEKKLVLIETRKTGVMILIGIFS